MEWQRLILPLLILASLHSVSRIGATEPPRGQIIERLMCEADANQSYALYLPSNYTPEKKWPILYALDPGARGRLPVERFKDAAEKYGYILAGSNNSRNGPMGPTVVAIRALLEDTRTRFSLDPNRVYLAGFSGGARVAVSLAYSLKGSVAGVIACGAGFPAELKPSASMPFVYFGTTGVEDFNFPEMMQLDHQMEDLGIPHRIGVFEGGHDWPPIDLCTEAIGWMELQAMKSGKREKSENLIDELLQKSIQRARADESSKEVYRAFLDYQALAIDFKGLRDVKAFEGMAEKLKNSRDVKQSYKKEKEDEEAQNRLVARFYALKEGHRAAENPSEVIQELNDLISDLKKRAARNEDSSARLVARRVLSLLLVRLGQDAENNFDLKNFELAAFDLTVATSIRPESPRLFYNLACAYSRAGRKKEAVVALKKAIGNGFADISALDTDPDLEPVRKEASFQSLVKRLRKKAK